MILKNAKDRDLSADFCPLMYSIALTKQVIKSFKIPFFHYTKKSDEKSLPLNKNHAGSHDFLLKVREK